MIMYYLIIGLIFAASIDYIRDRIERKWPSLLKDHEDFDAWTRILMVILWPLCLVVFLMAFYDTYSKK